MRTLIGHDASLPETIEFAREHVCEDNRIVLLSRGARGACLISATDAWQLAPPENLRAVNTVGCGDALLAGFLDAWMSRKPLPDALRQAIAFASAAAQEETAGDILPDLVHNTLRSLPSPESLFPTPTGSTQP
jgi:fructose-1-phosphate kinase PfkB-like protein